MCIPWIWAPWADAEQAYMEKLKQSLDAWMPVDEHPDNLDFSDKDVWSVQQTLLDDIKYILFPYDRFDDSDTQPGRKLLVSAQGVF